MFLFLVVMLGVLVNYKEGMLYANHAIDVSGILHDTMPNSTKIQMISMIGINEPEDPIFYNILIDGSLNADVKVTELNSRIEKWFNSLQS